MSPIACLEKLWIGTRPRNGLHSASEQVVSVFTAQVSNAANRPHFTVPNTNISTPDAGMYSAASVVDPYIPERLNYRQVHLKLRLES